MPAAAQRNQGAPRTKGSGFKIQAPSSRRRASENYRSGEDHKGYDVRSFEPDGEERLLEINTTKRHARTRFWLSRTQYEVAAQNPSIYRVRRVFHFQNGAEMFDIKPPLDAGLRLVPDKYASVPR
ncbi:MULTISPECIES: DUF3883 domain-containing protein [unclassified Bradyrhizobium]|uniref:DUF3883 domain-containing protein n=1 Tax=unclassified Bradyrhizobium TaxID=2631580 RepID=UPI0028E2EE3F|nr:MULTISPECIES: DUF3883 domain-containing protein [unclassified Bradyrhizobium]